MDKNLDRKPVSQVTHPVLLMAIDAELAAYKIRNDNAATYSAWTAAAFRAAELADMTDEQLDAEAVAVENLREQFADLTPANARPVDQEELDTNDLRHPEMM